MLWLAIGCAPFDHPWTDAEERDGEVSGGFSTVIREPLARENGWFAAGDVSGNAGSHVAVRSVDLATERVVQIVVDADDGGWNRLELDVAESAWISGDVALDGKDGVGQLTFADGSVRYALDGVLHLGDAGLAEGEAVSGDFTAVPLWKR